MVAAAKIVKASSQVGMSVTWRRAVVEGAVIAIVSAPSAVVTSKRRMAATGSWPSRPGGRREEKFTNSPRRILSKVAEERCEHMRGFSRDKSTTGVEGESSDWSEGALPALRRGGERRLSQLGDRSLVGRSSAGGSEDSERRRRGRRPRLGDLERDVRRGPAEWSSEEVKSATWRCSAASCSVT